MYTLADGVDVIGLLLGQVGDTHTAGQIDKGDMCTGLALQAHGKFKEDSRELGVVIVGDGVAGKEGMDAKVLGALALSMRKASKSCSVVMPYLESPGLSIMPLESWNRPPGLKRQLTVLGMGPATRS